MYSDFSGTYGIGSPEKSCFGNFVKVSWLLSVAITLKKVAMPNEDSWLLREGYVTVHANSDASVLGKKKVQMDRAQYSAARCKAVLLLTMDTMLYAVDNPYRY